MSKKMNSSEETRFRELLMRKIDNEISREEELEFQEFIAVHPECGEEWDEHRKVKEAAQMVKFTTPPDEIWDSYWLGIYNRLERKIGWILLSIGSIVVIAYGLVNAAISLFADTSMPWWLKSSICIAVIGISIIFVSVLREKIFTYKSDPYKEIKR